jgi:hypothetical protein
MKKIASALLSELTNQSKQLIQKAELLKNLSDEDLNFREKPDSWSILECLEHLNLYGDYYLPAIQSVIYNSDTTPDTQYKSGWLGNYFAESMLPKEKLNKMNTFKDKNPIHSDLKRSVIDRFIAQQRDFIQLFGMSEKVNINKVKVAITISRWIKLSIGDLFRFLMNHNIRHFQQLERVEKAVWLKTASEQNVS